MEPTYAIVNEHFGFGFEKAVLDLSATKTPPDLLEHFGIGDDFQGVFLPEVRIFATTQKTAGTAFNVGARDCIIGLNKPHDVEFWGDFNIDVDRIGDQLDVGLRLYGVDGSSHDPQRVAKVVGDPDDLARYTVTVPSTSGPETENYLLFVDVRSGAAPFVITVVSGEDHPADPNARPDDAFFDDAANHPQDVSVLQRLRLFSTDQRVAIRVTSRNPGQRRVIVLDVHPRLPDAEHDAPPDASGDQGRRAGTPPDDRPSRHHQAAGKPGRGAGARPEGRRPQRGRNRGRGGRRPGERHGARRGRASARRGLDDDGPRDARSPQGVLREGPPQARRNGTHERRADPRHGDHPS